MDGGDFAKSFLVSIFKRLIISFVGVYACVCVRVHTHVFAGACGGQKRVWDPLELGRQMFV